MQEPITNLLGYAGSCCAALLHYLFGVSAWLLLGVSVYGIWYAVRRRTFAQEWDRIFAIVPLIASSCMLEYTILRWRATSGIIGHYLGQFGLRFLDLVSINVIWASLFFASFTIITRGSYIVLLKYMMRTCALVWSYRQVIVRPIFNIFNIIAATLKYLAVAGYTWFAQLIQGKNLHDESESVFEFESGQSLDQSVKQIHDDQFWQQYIERDAPKQEVPTSEKTTVTFDANALAHELHEATDDTADKEVQQLNTPPLSEFFKQNTKSMGTSDKNEELEEQARMLEEKLRHFGIQGQVHAIKPGPVVTLFEYVPAIDTKLSRITALEDDLSLALQALSIRIIAPIPGTAVVGFEVANKIRSSVLFNHMITSAEFASHTGHLPVILGKDTTGHSIVVDITSMPHLLLAGSTGSGKSVALHTMLVSLLCRKRPDELQLILIDPKRLEFSIYADIPHLLFPIITQARESLPVLQWAVQEMENRYMHMAESGVRTVTEFNARAKDHGMPKLPYLLIIIDELADLMLSAGRQIEEQIIRLSQMARAAGIHLVVATQRPSVDVVTGLIKANLPSRIALRVASKIDSRTIIDISGAEKLLGQGDMLYIPSGSAQAMRVHGAYITHEECIAVAQYWRNQQRAQYQELDDSFANSADALYDNDPLYHDVLRYLDEVDAVSISLLQRRFKIGYNRSARIIDMLESQGRIMPAQGSKVRKVIR